MQFNRFAQIETGPGLIRRKLVEGARSSKPRDMPVFARHSSDARISGTHESVARRNANKLDPYQLSAGWA